MTDQRVPLGALGRQYEALRPAIDAAVARTLASGWYVLGKEGAAFEAEWAKAVDAPEAVACANGTDAITLALLALGITRGDEVVIPALTAVPTATGVIQAGAVPVLADIDPATGLVTAQTIERVLTPRTRAVIPVHLYGQPCHTESIGALARARGLKLIEDAAQAHGARDQGRPLGLHSDAVTYSFYPSKNLGAYGDGGAVTATSRPLAEHVRRARNYGQVERYDHREYGINSRLDELQAGILRAKLPHLSAWNDRRRAIARRYDEALKGNGLLRPLTNRQGDGHVRHLYVVRTQHQAQAAAHLAEAGIETGIHYPRSLAEQPGLPAPMGEWREAAAFARTILTLPLYPELTDAEVERVSAALRSITARG